MNGLPHRIVGTVAWIAAAPTLHVHSIPLIILGALLAGAFAHGILSPDMDQPYYWTSKLIPGEHRGITHFWLWQALAWWAVGRYVPIAWQWLPLTLIVSWSSHLAADFVFGREGFGRGEGIPILPRWGKWQYAGLGFKSDGLVATVAMWAAAIYGAYLVIGTL